MPKTKVEVYDKDQLIYPFIENDHVTFSNGMKVSEMLDQSISMPKVIHEDLSFKVGVGDQDVSSAIVDSSVSEMTIKGKTYQNILPEPSTHVLTNNKEMFKVNEGLDSNVEIVDGVSKSAILSGRTLVNLVTYDKTNLSTSIWNHFVHFSDLKYNLKSSTKYLLIFNITNCNVNSTFTIQLDDKSQYTYFKGKGIYINGNGVYKTIRETKDDLSNISSVLFTAHNPETTSGTYDMKIMIIEYQDGMENWDIPYFDGMQSVKMPVLTTTGKNLYDTNKLVNDESVGYKFPLREFKVGKEVVISVKEPKWIKISTYSSGASTHQSTNIIKLTFTMSESLKDKYIMVNNNDFTPIDDVEWLKNNVQVEYGTSSTSYEPYKSNILSCNGDKIELTEDMFEQGSFSESTTPNTQPYEGIKLNSGGFYNNRIRTKGTYKVVQGATYEGQLNDGYGIFICYCKNGLYSTTVNRWFDETRFTFTVPNDCDEMFFALRKTDNSAITPSDYSRIGLKIHQEVVLRSLPNGVCDTLNLNTGEYVQRIGEVVLDGSENWGINNTQATTTNRFILNGVIKSDMTDATLSWYMVDKLPKTKWSDSCQLGITLTNGKIFLYNNSIEYNISALKSWLSQNPITVQYELAIPTIKTVDLSSSGNWEKIVLDGSEDWRGETIKNGMRLAYILPRTQQLAGGGIFSDKLKSTTQGDEVGIRNSRNNGIYLQISDDGTTIKQWVTANAPLTVWYQTITTQDSTQVKQPIFFKDGHIQLSSGADNSLIPTLDYQAKTSNSYVMDLMKANTRYTMKAKTASGTFTIDGTSYGAGTNGTFTTPSSMTNKLLVMSNNANEEIMILEGDVTSKTIPYFKGIKSAFEDESKIEVLSTGKNLYPYGDSAFTPERDGWYFINGDRETLFGDKVHKDCGQGAWFYLEGGRYYFNVVGNDNVKTLQVVGEKERLYGSGATIPKGWYALRMRVQNANQEVSITNVMVEKDTETNYQPYKSNSTKIPLLSPLRKLPNGVYDEVILDRENHKAKIIQRVGKAVLNGSEVISLDYPHVYNDTIAFKVGNTSLPNKDNGGIISDTLKGVDGDGYWLKDEENIMTANLNNFKGRILRSKLTLQNAEGVKRHLQQNPLTVYYELATPVITEVDLEGFPYIYKDGHIFLNSEIAPTMEITYSINQCQQISASNENIIRHEKELTYLQKIIAQYVQVDYESALLSLKV